MSSGRILFVADDDSPHAKTMGERLGRLVPLDFYRLRSAIAGDGLANHLKRAAFFSRLIWELLRAMLRTRKVGYTAVIAFRATRPALVAACLPIRPKIILATGSDVNLLRHGDFVREQALKWIWNRCDAFVAFNEQIHQRLEEFVSPRIEIQVFFNGIDLSIWNGKPKTLGQPIRLYCARSFSSKLYNQEPLVRAFAHLMVSSQAAKNAELHFAGDGQFRTDLMNTVRELNIEERVFFHGNLGPNDLCGLAKRCHFIVNPTLSDGTSNALIEGMACGCVPIAARNEANVPWVSRLEDSDGLFFDPTSDLDIAHALEVALRMPGPTFQRLSEQAYRVGQECDMDRQVSRLLDLVRQMQEPKV